MEIKYVMDPNRFPGEIIMKGETILNIIESTFLTLNNREEKEGFLDAMKIQLNSYRGVQSEDASTGDLLFDPSTGAPIYGFDLEFERIIRVIDPSV